MPEKKADPSIAAGRKTGIGWFKLLLWLLIVAGLVFLYVRSYRRTDVLAFYTRAGNIQGIASHRGHLLVSLSNLSFGPEKALTAETTSVSAFEGDSLYDFVYPDAQNRRQLFGFGIGGAQKGTVVGDAEIGTVVAPHWFAIALATIPLLFGTRGVAGRLRYRRRLRSGMCTHCGYDLRGSPGRCPECGQAPIATPTPPEPA